MVSSTLDFITSACPSWLEILTLSPGAFILAWGQLSLSKSLREWGGWRAGYSRKLFHVQVFLTAACLGSGLGLGPLCLYGAGVSFWVGWSLFHPKGLGKALIREEDFPKGRLYVVLPYFSTLLGGLTCQAWLPSGATAGLLVVGVCDALAEPVGIRWGRHPYRLPWVPWLKSSTRTLEGSLSVFLSACLIFLFLETGIEFSGLNWYFWAVAGALGVTLVEAFSPHGGDNFFLQVFSAAWVVFCCLV